MTAQVRIFTDGGSRSNPGQAAIGAVIEADGAVVAEISEAIGIATNNVAEYRALIAALEQALERGLSSAQVRVFLDSKLVVEQVAGNWKVKELSLKPYVQQAQQLVAQFSDITLGHVPREQNAHADALVNKALDAL